VTPAGRRAAAHQRGGSGARADPERRPRAADVRIHRVLADALVTRDLLAAESARDEAQDLRLPLGEAGRP
jgi:hypothetical protein